MLDSLLKFLNVTNLNSQSGQTCPNLVQEMIHFLFLYHLHRLQFFFNLKISFLDLAFSFLASIQTLDYLKDYQFDSKSKMIPPVGTILLLKQELALLFLLVMLLYSLSWALVEA